MNICFYCRYEKGKKRFHVTVDNHDFDTDKEITLNCIPMNNWFEKAIDEDVHIKCTGQSNGIILENLKYIDSCGKSSEIRIPYVPDHNDNQIEKIAQFLKPLKNVKAIKVLPYHNYAGSKYDALGMENTLPKILPSAAQIQAAEVIIQHKRKEEKY